jgi:ATP-dependent DNA helicase RecG
VRPDRLNPLFADAASLPAVGPAAQRALERLGIERVRDMLFHWPVGWRHTRAVTSLADAREGDRIAIRVRIDAHEPSRGRGPLRLLADGPSGTGLILAFFGPRSNGLAARLPVGAERLVAGRLDLWNGRFQMVHPELLAEPPAGGRAEKAPAGAGWADPVYPLTEGLTSRRLSGFARAALERIPPLEEWIEPSLLEKRQWPGFADALEAVHSNPDSAAARDRLAHDELFATQLAWALVRARRRRVKGRALAGTGRLTRPLLASLPLSLIHI